jgi:hypothetical protein
LIVAWVASWVEARGRTRVESLRLTRIATRRRAGRAAWVVLWLPARCRARISALSERRVHRPPAWRRVVAAPYEIFWWPVTEALAQLLLVARFALGAVGLRLGEGRACLHACAGAAHRGAVGLGRGSAGGFFELDGDHGVSRVQVPIGA